MKSVGLSQLDEHQRVVQHNLAMRRLVNAVQELSLARSLPVIMSVVRHAARELTGSDGATFVLRQGEDCYYADEEAIAPLWKGQRFPMTACISGWCMLNRLPAAIEDIYSDPRVPAHAYRPTFVKSLVMVPIRSSAPLGAIGNYWATPHNASPEEVEVIQALANTTAVAMENVQLYVELEQRVQLRTRQLEVANKELEAFSYSVSHDLRGPLSQIDGFAGLLEAGNGVLATEKSLEYLRRIRSASRHMATLIDDLLRLAKITRTELRIERLDLSAMVGGIITRLRGLEPDRRVDFRVTEALQCDGDRGLLQLAFENLLGNAWKYTSKRECALIEVGATIRSDRSLVFFVRDNGAGFDMRHAGKLFVPFQRLHREKQYRGHGIGLATVQRVIQRHGGTIWAEAFEDRGATFYLTLAATGS